MANSGIKVQVGDLVVNEHDAAAAADGLYIDGVKVVGSQAATVADPAACASMTFAAGSIDTGTDMTAAEAAAIVTDLAACKTAIDANNAVIDTILSQLETHGLFASS